MDDIYALGENIDLGKEIEPEGNEQNDRSSLTAGIIGRVASPPQKEATSDQFYFWVDRNVLVERTQIIRASSNIGGQPIEFYAVVDQVYRQSRKRNMGEESDENDGEAYVESPFESEGVTYAAANILRTDPPVYTPPLDKSPVFLCNEQEAGFAYGSDEIDRPLLVGQIQNGGTATAGGGVIDLDYLLGVNGGHMNVNGVAGRGTKSSFLLFAISMLGLKARQQAEEMPSGEDRLRIVPIILNVKGYDLFYIDKWNKNFVPDKHLAGWQVLGVNSPKPFEDARFFAPQMPGSELSIPTGRQGPVEAYSWSLSDVVERSLFPYLFAEEDVNDANFSALVLDIENWLMEERVNNDGTIVRTLKRGSQRQSGEENEGDGERDGEVESRDNIIPQNFEELLSWVEKRAKSNDNSKWKSHHTGTWRKLYRRLLKLLLEGNGVLRRYDQNGKPLDLAFRDTTPPIVVDLYGLTRVPELQRFVVATIFRQLVDERTGSNATPSLVYLVALDELNRFAPRGSKDAITQLIETVAAEMRSAGIILLGAQQQASKVSEKVIENAAIRVLGRSGSLELSQQVWRFLSEGARKKAASLQVDEKMIIQDNFREPLFVRVPFPVWAMRRGEVALTPPGATTASSDDMMLSEIIT